MSSYLYEIAQSDPRITKLDLLVVLKTASSHQSQVHAEGAKMALVSLQRQIQPATPFIDEDSGAVHLEHLESLFSMDPNTIRAAAQRAYDVDIYQPLLLPPNALALN